MAKDFRIGDRVAVLDDTISGIVSNIGKQFITIESSEGFSFEYLPSELVLLPPKKIPQYEIPLNAGHRKQVSFTPSEKKISKKRPKPEPVLVDLHIHQLRESVKGMSNYDMVRLQLDTAKQQLELAIKRKVPFIIFIHGIGKGVLKNELRKLLKSYDQLDFYDADFRKYGRGATEVRIYSKS